MDTCRSVNQKDAFTPPAKGTLPEADGTLFSNVPKELAFDIYRYCMEDLNELHELNLFAPNYIHDKERPFSENRDLDLLHNPINRQVARDATSQVRGEPGPAINPRDPQKTMRNVAKYCWRAKKDCNMPHLTKYRDIQRCQFSEAKLFRERALMKGKTLFDFVPQDLAPLIYSYCMEDMNGLHEFDLFKPIACSNDTLTTIKGQIQSEYKTLSPPELDSIHAVFTRYQKVKAEGGQPNLTNYKDLAKFDHVKLVEDREIRMEKIRRIAELDEERANRWSGPVKDEHYYAAKNFNPKKWW